MPRAGMDELVLVRAIDVLGQHINRGIPNRSRRWGDAGLGEALVIHNTDVLAAVITVVESAQLFCFLRTAGCLVQRL